MLNFCPESQGRLGVMGQVGPKVVGKVRLRLEVEDPILIPSRWKP